MLGYSFLRRSVEFVRQGKLLESLQTVASLAPVALGVVPYLAAFSTQHKDEAFLQAVAAHFPAAAHLRSATDRKAWVTDTYAEVNGVSRTIQALAIAARKTGRSLTVLTCLEQVPPTHADLLNFTPVGTFPLPEYESQPVAFPPFLEVIETIERLRFNELIISTPGPMGLTAPGGRPSVGAEDHGHLSHRFRPICPVPDAGRRLGGSDVAVHAMVLRTDRHHLGAHRILSTGTPPPGL